MKRQPRHDAGLSLAELLVTVAVIAIVAALATPWVFNQRDTAFVQAMKGDMRVISSAVLDQVMQNGGVTSNPLPTTLTKNTVYTVHSALSYRFVPGWNFRLVLEGAGTAQDPYTSYCLTGTEAGQNWQLANGSEPALGSCGL